MPPDHPLRYQLVNELHARPFPVIEAPATAVFLAFHTGDEAANRDREADRALLADLTTRFAAPPPEPGATHYQGPLGRGTLKWESHTEFVTYSAFLPGLPARPFDPAEGEIFPADWLDRAPGSRICAVMMHIEPEPPTEEALRERLDSWFVGESLAAARVVDGTAVIASDFRIDPSGFMRFAVFVRPGTGPRRLGRIVQRLCEIETYRAMSMLGLVAARQLSPRLNALEKRLVALVSGFDRQPTDAEADLHELLQIAAELESLAVSASFRFGATRAYETIVMHRIEVLREQRTGGRQTFAEFMMRRYDPAMKTVQATEGRLKTLAERAQRAADLLRTRVDVARSRENQALLASMDRRADLQLRLQHTVEGLSVVAISYYAVSLAAYMLAPLAEPMGLGEKALKAVLVPVVLVLAWAGLRRVRKSMH
jgi:uncharacterized membrane-anchored protein